MIRPVFGPSLITGTIIFIVFLDHDYSFYFAIVASITVGTWIHSRNIRINNRVFERTKSIVDLHAKKLAAEYHRKKYVGVYGEIDESGFSAEVEYFLNTILAPEIPEASSNDVVFWDACRSYIWAAARNTEVTTYTEADVPSDPYEFEKWTANILNINHWQARPTQGSGDQGADVIAEMDGKTCVIQCKRYGKPVGNKAVQEVFAAKAFYDAHHAAVVTTGGYTKSAKQLAAKNGVLLLNTGELSQLDELTKSDP